ncbi:phosphoethanolamine transferase [Bombella saccharophila]|uniref:Phosphoethanolamine transferase n=1 Tax=Bombella saccharophila TaxID=2967338 RepID=A0ABT3W840_9PROT|nr:phosphoethanolamine transferase [Bombella saccharophila]MCX5615249.1 phosphoethanolamine transferase [Bombella saccharophila]
MTQRPHAKTRHFITTAWLGIYLLLNLFVANNCELAQHRLAFSLASLSLPFFFLSCGRFVACLFSLPLTAIVVVNLYIIIHYHKITYDICMAIAGTDSADAANMLRTIPITSFLLAGLLLGGVLYATARAARFRPLYALFGLIGCALTFTIALHRPLNRDIAGHYNVAITYDSVHRHYINSPYFAKNLAFYVNLPGFIGTSLATLALNQGYQQAKAYRHSLTFTPHEHINSALLPGRVVGEKNIILIIGESDAARHHGLYGYTEQDTTPHLRTLAARGALCAISNAHSAASMTHNAVPMMISFLTPQNRRAILTEKNLIELARAHGYKTLWVGSHEGTSLYNSPIGYLSNFSEQVVRPDYSTLPLSVREHDDESLLPVLQHQLEIYRQEAAGHFIIIHLIGSHVSYQEKTTPEDRRALPHAGSYDQAIHHVDHLIATILHMVEQTLPHSTLLYSADHGEILTSPDNGMHGVYDGGQEQYRIPIYFAGLHHAAYCQQAEALRQTDGTFSQLMEKYILLTMMGYQLAPEALHAARQQDLILHSDGETYDYNRLPGPKAP